MSFRNDHDAAIARIDVLERELARERMATEQARTDFEAERAARKRLEAMVPADDRPIEDSGPAIFRTVVALIITISLISIYFFVKA
jgi:hypothetical protein